MKNSLIKKSMALTLMGAMLIQSAFQTSAYDYGDGSQIVTSEQVFDTTEALTSATEENSDIITDQQGKDVSETSQEISSLSAVEQESLPSVEASTNASAVLPELEPASANTEGDEELVIDSETADNIITQPETDISSYNNQADENTEQNNGTAAINMDYGTATIDTGDLYTKLHLQVDNGYWSEPPVLVVEYKVAEGKGEVTKRIELELEKTEEKSGKIVYSVKSEDLKYLVRGESVMYQPSPVPKSSEGKKFKFWKISFSSDNKDIFENKSSMTCYDTNTLRLIAVWEDVDTDDSNTYNIKYEWNPTKKSEKESEPYVPSDNINSIKNEYPTTYSATDVKNFGTLTQPQKTYAATVEGGKPYVFAGWYLDKFYHMGPIQTTEDIKKYVGGYQNVTLYAKWDAVGRVRYWLNDSPRTGADWKLSDDTLETEAPDAVQKSDRTQYSGPYYIDKVSNYCDNTGTDIWGETEIKIPTAIPTRPGYTFREWDQNKKYQFGTEALKAAGEYLLDTFQYDGHWNQGTNNYANEIAPDYQTYNARWDPVEVVLTYKAETGGSVQLTDQSGTVQSGTETVYAAGDVKDGVPRVAKGAKAVPAEGYYFTGWTKEGQSETIETDATLTRGTVDNYAKTKPEEPYVGIYEKTTFVAHFAPIEYSVVFHINDGTAEDTEPIIKQDFTYGESEALMAVSFTRPGYTFMGWSTTKDGQTPVLSAGGTANVFNWNITPASASYNTFSLWKTHNNGEIGDLYAIWRADVTITYRATEGGSVKDTKTDSYLQVASESVAVLDGKPVGSTAKAEEGYWFVEWRDSKGNIVGKDLQYIPVQDSDTKAYKEETYTAYFKKFTPIDVVLNGTKEILLGNGATTDLKAGDIFDFTLTPVNGAPMPFDTTGAPAETYTVKNSTDSKIVFPQISYTKPGTYEYTITENDTSLAVNKDTDTVYVKVIVSYDESQRDGVLHAEVKYAKGSSKPGDITEATFKFSNKATGSLAISKTVAGNGAEENKDFTFTVTLLKNGADPLTERYPYTITSDPGVARAEATEIGNGGTLTLRHGQTATITGLPAGTTYTVKETGSEGYTVASTNAEGTIARGETALASFVNTKIMTPGTITISGKKYLNESETPDSTETFQFVLERVTADAPMPTGAEGGQYTTGSHEGVFSFGEIRYTKEGRYEYKISEADIDLDPASYIQKDKDVVRVLVDVEDKNKDGSLQAEELKVSYIKANVISETLEFHNATTGGLNIKKTVQMGAGVSGVPSSQFSFQVNLAKPDGVPVNGTYTYDVMTGSGVVQTNQELNVVNGQATLKLQDGQTATIKGLPTGTSYTVTEIEVPTGYTVSVKDSEGTTASGTIPKKDAVEVAFTNTYNPLPTTVTPSITKKLEVIGSDRRLNDEEFSFTMSWKGTEPDNGAQLPENKTAKNDAKGAVTFDAIQFTKAGTYTVVIKEEEPEPAQKVPGVTYSSETVEITYTVTDKEGQLVAESSTKVVRDGVETANSSTITNTYQPKEVVSEVPPVTKILNGKTLAAGEFTFEIKLAENYVDGIKLPEEKKKTNAADGKVNFAPITFTKTGVYKVRIQEVIPTEKVPEIEYDEHICEITYTVADLKGELVAGVSKIEGILDGQVLSSDENQNWSNFTNVYTPSSVTVEGPKVTKKVMKDGTQEMSLQANAYTFNLALTSNNTKDVDPTSQTAKNDANGKVTFGDITFAKEGTYIFHITEEIPADTVPGMTYDNHTCVVVYTVTRNMTTGKLEVEVMPNNDTTFTNTLSTGSLAITKQVTGTDTSAQQKEFTFTVGLTYGGKALDGTYTCTVAGGSASTITNGETITLKHGQTATISGLPAGTTYIVKETNYSANGFAVEPASGEQSGTISGGTTEVTFINTRDLTPATAEIKAKKTVDGRTPVDGELFGFVLKPVEQEGVITPMPTGAQKGQYTKYNVGGDIIFPTLTYDKTGTYYYTITENEPTIAVEKDPKTVWVKVVVADTADNGTLNATVTYAETSGGESRPADTAFNAGVLTFANKSQSGSLSIRKNVYGTGADLTKEFTFTVALKGTNLPEKIKCKTTGADTGASGTEQILTVTDNKVKLTLKHGQTATLSDLPAGTGYTVNEEADADYTTTSTGSTGTIRRGQTSSAVFYNAKKTTDGTFQLHGVKYLDGGEPTTEQFTFILKPTGNNAATAPMPTEHTTGSDVNRVCTVQNSGASIDFGELKFTEDGKYTYTISEQTANGFIIDKNDVELEFVASDFTNDGQRNVSVTCTKDDVVFPNGLFVFNNYSTGSLSVSKKVTAEEGKTVPKDAVFHFQVNLTDSLGNPVAGEFAYETTGAAGSSQTLEVSNGKAAITLKAGEKATISGLPTGTLYTVTETNIPNGFTPDEDTKSGTVVRGNTAEAAFENHYEPEAVSVRPQITKILTALGGGERPLRANEFGFEMKLVSNSNAGGSNIDGSGIVMPSTLTARNNQNGAVIFQPIRFTSAGTYVVQISETVPVSETGKVPGVTYSNDTVTITYEVQDVNGELQVTPDGNASAGTITNTYQPKAVSAEVPPIKKILNGKVLTEGMFTFTMELEPNSKTDGIKLPGAVNGVSSATNSAGGSVNFADIEFTQAGTYIVDVKETKYADPQMMWDEHTCRITYTVTDDNGQLKAGVSKMEYAGKPNESQNASIFINEYAPKAAEVAGPKLTKELTGREKPLAANEFEFKAEVISGVEGDVELPVNARNQADGSVQFGNITFRRAGTYVLRFSEVPGSAKGITYDTANKYVLSYVVTNSDGVLTVAPPVVVSGSDTFENVFTPDAVTVEPTVKKQLNGRELKAGEFSFTIALTEASDRDGITLPLNRVAWNDANGNVEFDAIRFTKTGTYTVTIYEQKGNVPGVTYAENTVTLTYTVSDTNQDGVLEVVSSAVPADATFVNTYVPTSTVGVVPMIRKVLDDPSGTGRTLQPGEFTFTMSIEGEADGYNLSQQQLTASNDADGNVEFGNIEFTKAGTYVVTIQEQKGNDAHIAYDAHVCKITYIVTDEDGHLQRTRAIEGDIIYTNTYTPAPATAAAPAVRKVLNGERALGKDDFTFHMELEQGDSTGITLPANAKNEADGSVRFGDITFTKAGVYVVGISEATGAELGVQYDPKVYEIIYKVTDKNGALEAAATVPEGGIVFTNTYDPGTAQASVPLITKVLQGGTLKAEQFTFTLSLAKDSAADGITLPAATAKNRENGSVSFGDISFTKAGVYKVEIREQIPQDKGTILYDEHVCTATYTVTDAEGWLKVTRSIDGATTFTNTDTYRPDAVTVAAPQITKELTGRELKAGEFTFGITCAAGDRSGVQFSKETAVNGADGKVDLGSITFTAPGTYIVSVSEQKGNDPRITYDATTYALRYVVTDENGKLAVQQSVVGGDAVFKNTYTPKKAVVELTGDKIVYDGGEPQEYTGKFTFTLTPLSEYAPMPDVATATNAADGTFTFHEIEYATTGTWYYTITETGNRAPGVTSDTGSVYVNVTVTASEPDGELQAAVTYEKKGEGEGCEFINTYQPKPVTVGQLKAHKTVEYVGAAYEMKGGEFKFQILSGKSNPLGDPIDTGTVTNDANGEILLTEGPVTYTMPGTYRYTVEELREGVELVPGMTYDTNSYVILVNVTDDGSGNLTAEVIGDDITFTNIYSPNAAVVVLGGQKNLTDEQGGELTLKGGEFTFVLEEGQTSSHALRRILPDTDEMDKIQEINALPDEATIVFEDDEDLAEETSEESTETETVSEEPTDTEVTDESSTNAEVTNEEPADTEATGEEPADTEATGKDSADTEVASENPADAEVTGESSADTEVASESPADAEVASESPADAEVTDESSAGAEVASETPADAEATGESPTGVEVANESPADAETISEALPEAEQPTETLTEAAETQIVAYQLLEPGEAQMIRVRRNGRAAAEKLPDGENTDALDDDMENGVVAVAVDTPMPIAAAQTTNSASGSFRFGALTFTEAGIYTYRIREVNDGKAGYTYDGTVYDVTVTVVDQDGSLKAEVSVSDSAGSPTNNVIFNNKYKPKPASYRLEGQKWLQGGAIRAGQFSFTLYDYQAGQTEDIKTVQNDGDGKFAFDLSFAAAGTYYYMVREEDTGETGVTYDGNRYTAAIRVTDNGEGALQVTGVDVTKQATGESVDRITFTNTYKAPVASITIAGPRARKELSGRTLQAGEFMFELRNIGLMNEIGSVNDSVVTRSNDEQGKVEFPEMTFESAGEYYYLISEQPGSLPDVTYDTAYYVAAITVTEEDGELQARITYWNQAGEQVAERDVVFRNTYTKEAEPENTEVIRKSHIEKQYCIGDEVTFTITVKNAYSSPMKVQILEQQGVTITGSAEFGDVAPGSSVTTTAVYKITAQDVKNGYFTNTATAKLVGEDEKEHSFQAEDTVENIRQDYSYIVKYVNKDSGQEIHGQSEAKNAKFGDVISGAKEAIAIEGYTFVEAADLTVSENEDKNVVTVYYQPDFSGVKAEGFDVVYDGQTHTVTVSGTLPGDVITFHDRAGAVRAADNDSQAPSIRDVRESIEEVVVSVTRGGSAHEIVVPAIIRKRPVTLASADLSKKYDGTPLTNGSTALAQDGYQNVEKDTGWVTGEGAELAFVGSQTEVGSSPNNFTCAAKDGTDFGNYEIKMVYGTLTVSQADEPSTEQTEPSTEAPTEGADCSITVTKSTVNGLNGHLLGLRDAAFYVVIFADADLTQPVCDPLELSFSVDSAVSNITLEGLTPGTYYVAETDASGKVVEDGSFEGGIYTVHYFSDRQAVTVSERSKDVEFAFENQFATLPDEMFYQDLGLPEGETEPETETEIETNTELESETIGGTGTGTGTPGGSGTGTGTGSGTAAPTSANPAQTGDGTPIAGWLALMLASGIAALAALTDRRRSKKISK